MKDKRSSWLFRGAVTMAIITLPYFAMAQTDPGPCPDCPIDNGLVLLIAVGLWYGVKKYWAFTKNKILVDRGVHGVKGVNGVGNTK